MPVRSVSAMISAEKAAAGSDPGRHVLDPASEPAGDDLPHRGIQHRPNLGIHRQIPVFKSGRMTAHTTRVQEVIRSDGNPRDKG
ncbi:hypothetical protein [Nocardia sp. NPDC046763]|uniref:hypothetical protein n=1 Tax=Nocardia sp. NPDC046763 TaxID=3155256 RepID=UPI0033D0CFB8